MIDKSKTSVGDIVSAASHTAGETAQRGEIVTRGHVPSIETQQAVNRERDPYGTRTGGAISVGDVIRANSVEAFAAAESSKASAVAAEIASKAERAVKAERARTGPTARFYDREVKRTAKKVHKGAHVLENGICVSCG